MSVNGYLSDFSLPEVFQLLQDGKKTGLLSIQGLASAAQKQPNYYFIWLHRGRIVTVANRLDSRGLAALITKRRYLSAAMTERLIRRCPPDEPLGRFLRSQGVLTTKQLQILFASQVMRQVCDLFRAPDGYFIFDPEAPMPKVEMTGLSVMATEVVLPGLRILKDWDALQDKLPHPKSALVSLIRGRPHVRINKSEWNVWRLIDEKITLSQIAGHLSLPIEEIQRIAFRLIFVGLAEEVPKLLSEPTVDIPESLLPIDATDAEKLSPSFFRNLISLLRQMPKSS
ncbi:MAG: DUF4388 domain-containing protein [Leptolyngbya sp. SIO3F4]|nr:DUF4388 domain-containing protein [Leptolyngbya sp. SIO3F4]